MWVARRRVLGLAACVVAAPGLSWSGPSNHFPDFTGAGVDGVSTSDDEIVLTVYPMVKPSEMQTYFGEDLTRKGFVPLWVSVTNRTTTATFLLEAERIAVARATDSTALAERDRSTVSTRAANTVAQGSVALFGAFGLPIALVAGGFMAEEGSIRRNLVERQLYQRTVRPGQTIAGFVYPKVDRPFVGFAGYRVAVPMRLTTAPDGTSDKILFASLG